jgi:hypothetical protein
MPNRNIHNLICELAGIDYKTANYVNKMMDLPSQVYGSQHRHLFHGQHIYKTKTKLGTIQVNKFRLDAKDMVELYSLTKFHPDAIKAWVLHLMADGVAEDTTKLYSKQNIGIKYGKTKTHRRRSKAHRRTA